MRSGPTATSAGSATAATSPSVDSGTRAREEQADGEGKVVDEVAPEEPARFQPEAVDPLETGSAHPDRGRGSLPRRDRERSTDTDKPCARQPVAQLGNQSLLLRAAERTKNDIGCGIVQRLDDPSDLGIVALAAHRGGVRAG